MPARPNLPVPDCRLRVTTAVVALAALCVTASAAGPASRALPPGALCETERPPARARELAGFRRDAQAPEPRSVLARTPCVGGFADIYPCFDVDLESFRPFSTIGGGNGNDVWGWTDPTTGKEYALVGRTNGTSFVDISDPASPVYLGNLPTHTADSIWRDVKVYQDHAFVVSEAADHGMQVFDLRRLRNLTGPPVTFTEDAHYGGFGSAHNVAINEEIGMAYATGSNTCAGGLHMVDIRNPRVPGTAGCVFADGYTHDAQCVVYRGPDAAFAGRPLCFCANEDTLTIVDVSDGWNPVQISRTGYTGSAYAHQGWVTEDQAYFLLDDEIDEVDFGVNTTTHIWDVRSLAAPRRFSTFVSSVGAIDHNVYVEGRRAYQSNYRAGLRILDLGCIAAGSLSEVGYFDVYPADNAPRFNGTWSNYPYFASGVVAVNTIEEGLFLVRPRVSSPPPLAVASAVPTICAGGTATLDGSRSIACSAAGLRYRWLAGSVEVCPWWTSPTCLVTPASTRDYTLQIECLDGSGCRDEARVTVTVAPQPRADAGPDRTSCAGSLLTLDASASGPCSAGSPRYRWLAGLAEVCAWSSSPLCDVSPTTATVYTLQVSCDVAGACASSDSLGVVVEPATRPGSLGNSLRGVKAALLVELSWAGDPVARSYALYRSTDPRSWAPAPHRTWLALPASSESDVPGPPFLYTYRAVGASCSGQEGP